MKSRDTCQGSATQADPKRQPLYTHSGLNGKPALQFDGADDVLSGNMSLASEKTVFVAFQPAPKWQADSCCSGIATFWDAGKDDQGESTNGIALKTSAVGNVLVLDYAGENNAGQLNTADYSVSIATVSYARGNSSIYLDDCEQVALEGSRGKESDLFSVGYRASDPVSHAVLVWCGFGP